MVCTRKHQYPIDVASSAPALQLLTTPAPSTTAVAQAPSTSIQDIYSSIQGELSGLSPELKAVVGAISKAFEVYSESKD